MKRIAVIGPAGAGKSQLAQELGRALDIRVVHLDELYWKPGWVETPEDEWEALQRRELTSESWVVEAQYDDMIDDWRDAADTVVFLDASPLVCFWRVTRRRLGSDGGVGTPRGSQPAPAHRAFAKFLRRQWHYRRRVRGKVLADLARRRNGQRVVVLRGEDEQRNFLAGT
jgi:hypothetical protein